MDMVEKVARAIYAEVEKQDQWVRMPDNNQSMDSVQIDGWVNILAVARAAIEAMREPTPEMVEAIDQVYGNASPSPENGWRVMIDAALKATPASE